MPFTTRWSRVSGSNSTGGSVRCWNHNSRTRPRLSQNYSATTSPRRVKPTKPLATGSRRARPLAHSLQVASHVGGGRRLDFFHHVAPRTLASRPPAAEYDSFRLHTAAGGT